MAETDRLYRITWDTVRHEPPLTRAEVDRRGRGACDDLVLISIIERENGWRSYASVSLSGKTGGPLPAKDVYKAWLMLAKDIAEDGKQSPVAREIAHHAFEEGAEVVRETLGTKGGPTPLKDRVEAELDALLALVERAIDEGAKDGVAMSSVALTSALYAAGVRASGIPAQAAS